MGSGSGPDSLSTFLYEREFWQLLGLNAEAIDRMPWKKHRDYRIYIELLDQRRIKDEQAQAAQIKTMGR